MFVILLYTTPISVLNEAYPICIELHIMFYRNLAANSIMTFSLPHVHTHTDILQNLLRIKMLIDLYISYV